MLLVKTKSGHSNKILCLIFITNLFLCCFILDDEKEETKPEPHNLSEIKEEPGDEDEKPVEKNNQDDEDDESSADSSDNESKFPDTQIKIQHFEGTKYLLTCS